MLEHPVAVRQQFFDVIVACLCREVSGDRSGCQSLLLLQEESEKLAFHLAALPFGQVRKI